MSFSPLTYSPALVCTDSLLEKATRKTSEDAFHNYTSG